MRLTLRQRLQTSSGKFVKSSFLLAAGFAIARVLGLLFSLLLGRVLPASDYGTIQLSITVAGIIAIGTQPLLQHTMARFVSVHRADPERLGQVVSTIFSLLVPVTLLTMVLTLGYFAFVGSFNIGALLIFVGLTIYYAYYGLARGFEDSTRLTVVFIASNLVQFLALLVVYYLLNSRSTLPALAIYGLSYVLPVLYLTLAHPLPVRFSRSLVSRDIAGEVLRFSTPVWASHALFIITAAGEVMLLTALLGVEAAGVYAFTRTLCFAFDFLPSAISTIIMPRAAVIGDSRKLIMLSSGLVVLVNTVIGFVFITLYPWFVGTFFDASYQQPILTVIIIIVAQTLAGVIGILQGVTTGKNRPQVELFAGIVGGITLYTAGYLLIPRFGVQGAAMANLTTVLTVMAVFPLLVYLTRGRKVQD